MFKRILAVLIAVLIVSCAAAYAQGLPTVLDSAGNAAAFTAAEATQPSPEAGDWNRDAEIITAPEGDGLDSFRTAIAIKATELDFNSYVLMTYAEKASVVVKYLDYLAADASSSFYAEADDNKANNAVFPAYATPGGEFAAFAYVDGMWRSVGSFALTNDANATGDYFLVDLSCYEIGDAPAYLAWYDSAAALWHIVGVNQAYVDAAIAVAF